MAAAVGQVAASPRRPLIVFAPIGAAIALILGLFGYALLHGVNAGRTNTLIGHAAPDFTYSTFDGKTVELSSLRGKPVMVNFWGSWCVPCQDEAPVLAQAWQKYQHTDVQFVGIAIWDQTDPAKAFAQTNGAVWTNGMDNNGQIAIDYGVYGVPETFFIGRDGTLENRYVGPFVSTDGSAKLDQYLQALLAQ